MKGWVGLVGWPVADGLPSGHPSAAGRTQDKECSPVRDRRSTTVPRRQPIYKLYQLGKEEYLLPFIRIALDWNVRSCWTYCWSWMEHAKRRSASTSPPWPGVSLDSLVFVQKVSRIALCDQCEFMWPGIKTVCVMSAYTAFIRQNVTKNLIITQHSRKYISSMLSSTNWATLRVGSSRRLDRSWGGLHARRTNAAVNTHVPYVYCLQPVTLRDRWTLALYTGV